MPKHPLGGPHSRAKRAKHLPPELAGVAAPAAAPAAAAAAAAPAALAATVQLTDATIRVAELMAPVPAVVDKFAQLPTMDLTPMEYVESFAVGQLRVGQGPHSEVDAQSVFEEKLRHKGLTLAPAPARSKPRAATHVPPHRLPAARMREIDARTKDKEPTRYADHEPLHALWSGYMQDLLRSVSRNEVGMQGKLVKADLHGAILSVVRSTCPSLVRAAGIVVRETENAFVLVTRADCTITVPKANSVFELTAGPATVTIYGNNFCFRASERAVRKFKTKGTIDL